MDGIATEELERMIFNWQQDPGRAERLAFDNALSACMAAGVTGSPERGCPDQIRLGTEADMPDPDARPLALLLNEALRGPADTGLVLHAGPFSCFLDKAHIRSLQAYVPRSRMIIVRRGVLDVHAGAIVNAANRTLLGGGGVDGAIHAMAGPDLLKECRMLGGCRTGEARLTGAYQIRSADVIIHTVGPVYSGAAADAELLGSCYRHSLDLAVRAGCRSIAFPCLSTGAYGYPLTEAAPVALRAMTGWLDAHEATVMNLFICCYREAEKRSYADALVADTVLSESPYIKSSQI